MIKLTLDVDKVHLAENLLADSPKQLRIAASQAINRTITTIRSKASVIIRERYTIAAKNIKPAINIKRAMKSSLEGAVIGRSSPLPLSAFKLTPNPEKVISSLRAGKTGMRGKVIRVQVLKGKGSTPVKGLFIQKSSRSNYAGLMLRYLKTAYPLRIPYGPSIPQMLGNELTIEKLVPLAEETLNKRFLHEVEIRYEKGLK